MTSIAIAAALALIAGCTKSNPDFCCATEAECAALDVDELRPCRIGQACKANMCVAAECQMAAECTGPDARCVNGLCVSGCELDTDCAGFAGTPYCVNDHCVECKFSAQCPIDRGLCDSEDNTCRGCELDAECGNGVCIEATGECVSSADVIYVAPGGTNAGDCTKEAPCLTIEYGVSRVSSASGARRVVKVSGGTGFVGATPLALPSVVIDGTSTTLVGASRPLFTVSAAQEVTIEGVRVESTDGTSVVNVSANGKLHIADSIVDHATLAVDNASVDLLRVRLVNVAGVDCTNGSIAVTSSDVDRSLVATQFCNLVVRTSRLGPANTSSHVIRASGNGPVTIENNVFTETSENVDLVYLYGYASGSTFRFNTVVNTAQPTTSTGLFCGSGSVVLQVSSNIFAYGTQPALGCVPQNSLFDQAGTQAANAGTNNVVGERALFFKSESQADYHLASGSPAIGIGQEGLVSVDRDGNPRPMPAGSKPDAGAYEAP